MTTEPAATVNGLPADKLADQVMETFDELMGFLASRLGQYGAAEDKAKANSIRAAQAIAIVAMADHFLKSMPLEVAAQYRAMAREFNAALEENKPLVEPNPDKTSA